MDTLLELFRFMVANKKLWLIPTILMMVLVVGLIVVTEGSPVAPFIYAIF